MSARRDVGNRVTHVHAVEALIPLIVRNARDLIAIVDTRGRRVFCSASYSPLLGDPESLVGGDSLADIHPEDRERIREIFRETVETGIGRRTEYRLVARDGTERVIQSEGSAMRDDHGRVAGVVVVGRDVTEERRAAAQLDAALRRQTALAKFSLFALRESDPVLVVKHAVTHVAEELQTDFVNVLELEPDGKALRVVAGSDWPQLRIGTRIGAGAETQSGRALELYRQSGPPAQSTPPFVAIEDLRSDPHLGSTYRVCELGVVSGLCVVIPAAERPYGTLVAHWRRLRHFEPVEVEFLQAVANVLSAALERGKAHAELCESEERFRCLTELSSDYYWEMDAEFRFVRRVGMPREEQPYPLEEVLGKTRWDLPALNLTAEDWAKHRADLEAHREFRDFEVERPLRSGETRWISASGRPIFDAEGRFCGYRGIGQVITRQKLAERARAESEQRYRTLFDVAPQPVYVYDSETLVIVAANRRMTEQYGWPHEELVGMNMLDLRPPSQRAAVEAVARGRFLPGTREWRHRRRNGEEFDVEVTAHEFEFGGRPCRLVIVNDITERKRAETALRESRRLLARAQEIAGLGYWEYDLARREVRASRELRRLCGVDPELGPQALDWILGLIQPEDREPLRAAARRAIDEGTSYKLEVRVVLRDGRQRRMLVSGEAVRDDAGRATKLIGTCLDITEQRRREEELCSAADQLQALSRRLVEAQETERRRLAAELHDRVGQNLTALGINLDILAGRLERLDAEAKRRLRDSLALLDQTALCIEGVLDELRPPMLDDLGLGPALRWLADEFSRRTEIAVRLHVQGTETRFERRHEVALLRIVQEALNNVAKHAHATQVEIALAWQTDAARVEVVDDGAGFATNEAHGRRGFGLVTMRERIEAAGGLLDVQSAPGAGTKVRALVPL